MPNGNLWILVFVICLTACAAPTPATDVNQTESTLPPPAVATVAPTVVAQPTDLAAVEPTPTLTPPGTETPTAIPTELPQVETVQGTFVDMEVPSSGSFRLDAVANTLTFSADFTTRSGPDLFVVLSGTNDVQQHYLVFSQNVVNAPILYLGQLTDTSGIQAYSIPAGTDLSQYHTVVIWCKTYSVAFAAALIE